MQVFNRIKCETQYKNARYNLLLFIIFSAINVISITFTDVYFLFSSYIANLLISIGAVAYVETANSIIPIVFCGLALLCIIPYLLCWIFSKKRYGWMIAALVLFSADTLLLLSDVLLSIGESMAATSLLIDVAFHGWVLAYLIMGVRSGATLAKAPVEGEAPLMEEGAGIDYSNPEAAPATVASSELSAITRAITVTRVKSFVGSAVAFSCYLDTQKVAVVKNKQTVTIPLDGNRHELTVTNEAGGAASNTVVIPAGSDPRNYQISVKMGLTVMQMNLEEIV